MRDDLARQTYDVLLFGLKLRERVAEGNRPALGIEQARLKSMLGTAQAPAPWGGGQDPTRSIGGSGPSTDFLGIRYALTCWLDEIMIEAGWREWDENKLENALYRTNIRYSNFWLQARLAEASPTAADALEAYLLCVLLGFRGELGETPDKLKEWVHTTRSRVTRGMGKDLPPLPEKAPVSDVPPLVGVESYRKMTQRLVGGLLFAVPVVAFLVVILLRGS
ncbi:MAG TPA: DotU family type IV/VI secretion system protein [Gemmataceae bacterium]|nr:DotU family type IV/VI secretion system protein [Gemmataceae bacterium]